MDAGARLFEIERQGETIIVTPLSNLAEFEYQPIEAGAADLFALLGASPAKNVVMDFHRTDYCGSTALAFFTRLWKRVRDRGGHMAFCNVSEHEKSVLRITRLDGLWPICSSREEAIKTVEQTGAELA